MRKATTRFVLFGAMLLGGCGDTSGDRVQSERHVLSQVTRVNVSTPLPVLPTAPTILGSNSVRIGARAEVVSGLTVALGTGGLQSEPDAKLNETWSRGPAVLRDRVTLRGTLHARTRTLGNSVVVPSWDSKPAFDPVNTLSWEVKYPDVSWGDFTLDAGEAGGLAPGRHGRVTLNSATTLNLEAGTYYFSELTVQSGAVVNLHAADGPVIVYVADLLTWRGSLQTVSGPERQLLLAYLGTNPVIAETRFDGALIAPSTTLTLRSVTGTHTGYFFAKDLVLDAGARVTYAPPVALVTAATPVGSACRTLLAGQVPEEDLDRYCPGCESKEDSDRDGVIDCVDACDSDPSKSVPGLCGCGVADTDTDGDGFPNCRDVCDLDPDNTSPGQCGCKSSDPDVRAPVAAGTPCSDSACTQASPTCNGQGVCGSRLPCIPAPTCRQAQFERSTYWFCTGPVTRAAAAQACAAKQMALVRIDGFSENLFVRRGLSSPAWIGANSISASGVWRWSLPGNNNGEQFWAGGAAGSQQNALYSSWAPAAPASGRCAVMDATTGKWVAVDCEQSLGYVCEFTAPIVRGELWPAAGGPDPGIVTTTCIPSSESNLPETEAGVDQIARDQALADMDIFTGSASNPPQRGTRNCPNPDGANAIGFDESAGCSFTPVTEPPNFSCIVDADCAPLGAGLRCRQVKEGTCVPDGTTLCHGRPRCGTLVCPPEDPEVDTCDQIQICNPGTDFDPIETGTLQEETFNPGQLFGGGTLPTPVEAQEYIDPPDGVGKDHAWCYMRPQQAIPNAEQPALTADRKAGESTPISFSFHPNARFEANANPLALGETDLGLEASAELVARVKLNGFLGLDPIEKDILSASAGVTAKRCSVAAGVDLEAFERDFVDIGLPRFDTADPSNEWYDEVKACNRAVGGFVTAANRAKKAFRDAQQLLSQYRAATGDGTTLKGLCETLIATAGANVDFSRFPDGRACPANEPAEITINRFIEYYQQPGTGEVSRLRRAIEGLGNATKFLRENFTKRFPFGPDRKGESHTLARGQFQLGPVPILVEIEAFYTYGINGYFDVGMNFPYDPFSDATVQRDEVAHVRAGVMPYSSAGVSAFVGAGGAIGPISASVGLDGSVTLGKIEAPIFVGAGLGAEIRQDVRPLPEGLELLGLAGDLTHFGRPKSAKFFVWYNYGAAIDVTDVLRGEINGRVRIRFAFLSRTWRKQIVKFKGMNPIRIDLVKGKVGNDPGVSTRTEAVDYRDRNGAPAQSSTKVVEGTADVGHSEPQVPLLVLKPLELPASRPLPDVGDSFDPTAVGRVFYDDQCCAPAGDACLPPDGIAAPGGPAPCCPGLDCRAGEGGSFYCFECGGEGVACGSDAECCETIGASRGICGGDGACRACLTQEDTQELELQCGEDSDCCGAELDPPSMMCWEGYCINAGT